MFTSACASPSLENVPIPVEKSLQVTAFEKPCPRWGSSQCRDASEPSGERKAHAIGASVGWLDVVVEGDGKIPILGHRSKVRSLRGIEVRLRTRGKCLGWRGAKVRFGGRGIEVGGWGWVLKMYFR